MERRQICIIGGATAFANDLEYKKWLDDLEISYERLILRNDWKPWLARRLAGCDVLMPQMPNKQNAKYADWAVMFSKVLTFLQPSATLIGHSMGGIFLTKYFSENPLTSPFASIILVAAPYDDETSESLGDFKLASASPLAGAASKIHLFQSRDDPVVPFTELAKFQRDLPEAQVHVFDDRAHFNQPEFPELLQLLAC